MHEFSVDIRDYIRLLYKGRKFILSLFVLTVIITYLITLFMPMIYESQATVLIVSSNVTTAFSPVSPIGNYSLETYTSIIKSRVNEVKVLEKFNLDKPPYNYTPETLDGMIKVSAINKTNLIKIIVKNEKPELTANIANELAVIFTEMSAKLNTGELGNTMDYLVKEYDRLKLEVEDLEEQSRAFESEKKPYILNERITLLQTKKKEYEGIRESTELNLKDITYNLQMVEQKMKEIEPMDTKTRRTELNPLVESLKAKLADLEIHLASLKEKYTENHSAVQDINARISEIKDKLKNELTNITTMEETEKNPIYQELEKQRINLTISLTVTQSKYTAIKEMLRKYINEYEELKDRYFDENLQQKRLNDQLEKAKKNYNLIWEKYENSKIAENMQIKDITLLDPASVPKDPVAPRRKMITLISGLFSVLAAFVLLLLREYFSSFKLN